MPGLYRFTENMIESFLVLLQPGAVYVSQSLHFRSPVYIGDEILGLVQATALRETKNKFM